MHELHPVPDRRYVFEEDALSGFRGFRPHEARGRLQELAPARQVRGPQGGNHGDEEDRGGQLPVGHEAHRNGNIHHLVGIPDDTGEENDAQDVPATQPNAAAIPE